MSLVYAPMLVAAAVAGEAFAEQRNLQKTAEECLLLDDQHVAGLDDLPAYAGGEWIDDGDILKTDWEPSMGVYAINYCISEVETFLSMQIIVGNTKKQVALRKHGGEGGTCRQWRLQADDYIREIQYTWNQFTGVMTQVVFKTHFEQTRVFGRGEGFKVNYEYTAFQPFVGLFSFENLDATLAFGAYEDDCHNAPKKLPFGFETFNIPSMAEIDGSAAVSSMTWVNEQHGTSSKEVELLDLIVEEELKEDSQIDVIPQSERVANVDFIEVNVNLEISTPPTPPPEKNFQKESPTIKPESSSVVNQAYLSSKQLQVELERVRKELVTKDNLLRQRVSDERYTNNSVVEKEESPAVMAWLLSGVMVFLVIVMLLVVVILCSYITKLKRQRRNAREIGQRSAVRGDSDIEAGEAKKQFTVARPIQSAVVGGYPSQLVTQNYHTKTPSTVGLVLQPDVNAETSQTHMLSSQTPIGTYMANMTDKLNKADQVVTPGDVQLDFSENQPEAFSSTTHEEQVWGDPFVSGHPPEGVKET